MFELRDVEIYRSERSLLRVPNLTFHSQKVSVVIGPNGVGKSSFLLSLVGLLPYRGSIGIDSKEVRQLSFRERAAEIAFVPQRSELGAAISVHEVIAQGLFRKQGVFFASGHERERVEEVAESCDVVSLLSRSFRHLSYGQQRRVLLARALIQDAKILVMDEPTAALDIGARLRFFELVRSVADEGRAVIYSHHAFEELRDALCDQLVLLHAGKAVSGRVDDVLTEENLATAFGVRRVGESFSLLRGQRK